MELGDAIQVAAIAVTAVVSVAALGVAWSARNASTRQAKASEDAVTAAAEANEIARRALKVAEGDAAARREPAFSLEWRAGSTYLLRNDGGGTAFDVEIAHECLVDEWGETTRARLEPTEAVAFMVAPVLGMQDDTVYVTWHRQWGADPQAWSHPRPGRPRNQE